MRPDAQLALRAALDHGPGHCPPDLLSGPVAAIVRGLKAHANTIAHARHVALEETYPRTRQALGEEEFHQVARAHLAQPATLRCGHTRIGKRFAERLSGAARDLASAEWAWIEAHGAADALPFDLGAIAGLDAAALAATRVMRHPAANLLNLDDPDRFVWDGLAGDAEPLLLITRPRELVILTRAGRGAASLLDLLDRPRLFADLLERDQAAAAALVTAGALTPVPEFAL